MHIPAVLNSLGLGGLQGRDLCVANTVFGAASEQQDVSNGK